MMNQKGHFMLTHAITADPVLEFASDVRAGLTRKGQKELLSKYLYDDVGSALFEVISVLPQYGLTRADERLLQRHAQAIADQVSRTSGCGGTGQRQRQEDPLDFEGALPSPAYFVFSYRNLSHRAGHVRTRTRRHRKHEHRGLRTGISGWPA